MRLIDADALIKAMVRKEPFNDCARVVIAECMEEVRHAPTIDPETEEEAYERGYTAGQMAQRKTGKWIKEYWNGEHTRKCSVCNITQTVTTYRGKVNFNFCPYCGADMMEEGDTP